MSYLQKDKTLEKENNFISQDLDWERGLLYADTHVAVDMDVEADVAEIKTGTEAEIETRMEKEQLKKNWSIFDLQYCVTFCCIEKWLSYIYIFFIICHILFNYGLSQDIGYSALCYTVGPCGLSILILAFTNLKFPIHPSATLQPPDNHESASMSVSLFLFRGYVHLFHILDSTSKWYHTAFVFLWESASLFKDFLILTYTPATLWKEWC